MAQRHNDALYIQKGACNLSGITRTLVKAIDEARAENADVRQDPACRLIMHQLCHLFGMNVDDSSSHHPAAFDYDADYQDCINHADAHTLTTLKLLHLRRFMGRAPQVFPMVTTPLDIPQKPAA